MRLFQTVGRTEGEAFRADGLEAATKGKERAWRRGGSETSKMGRSFYPGMKGSR